MRLAWIIICAHKAARTFTLESANTKQRRQNIWYTTGEVRESHTPPHRPRQRIDLANENALKLLQHVISSKFASVVFNRVLYSRLELTAAAITLRKNLHALFRGHSSARPGARLP